EKVTNFSKNRLAENKDTSIFNILEQARTAARGRNWLLVTQCLQELPLDLNNKRSASSSASLGQADCDIILKLAVEVLAAGDFQERWEVAKIFPAIGETAIAPLVEILEDEEADLEFRWFACRILGQFPQATAVMSLVKLLEIEEDEDLTEMAAQSLANLGSSAILPLSNLLAKEESRLLAVKALSHIRHPDTIAPWLTVVNDPLPVIRATAIESLNSFHHPQITTVLLAALKDTATAVRKEAIIGLGLRVGEIPQNCNLVNHLKPLLYDLNGEVCRQAVVALGRVGTDAAADALFPILKSPLTPISLKIEIVRGLSWMETAKALDYLQEGLLWGSESICIEIISVLGRIESLSLKPKATQIIIDFLHSGQAVCQETLIKQAIALSLGQLGESTGIDSLQELAEDDQEGVRLHAIAALKKFSY
ncbi:HEAT repeat domain-containing protein, partial [Limnofasciculus baicalensis]